MFIYIVCCTLVFISILTFRDRLQTLHFSKHTKQKSLNKIMQLISLQEWEKATKLLTPILAHHKADKEASLLEIQVLQGTGQLDEALKKIEHHSQIYPEELQFRLEQGKILLALKHYKAALEAFNGCSPILHTESDLYLHACAFYFNGYPQQCYDLLVPLLQKTENGSLIVLAGDALFELKLFSEAITCYLRGLEAGNHSHHALLKLGHAYRRFGNLGEAEKIFRSLLAKNPKDHLATLGLGNCLQERGHYHKAFFVYQSGLSWKKERELLCKAAYTALKIRKFRTAELYFQELIYSESADSQILHYYALSLEYQKKWQEAEQAYLKLLQLFPNEVQGYRALAWMFGVGLSQTVAPDQGILYAHRAIKLKNDSLSWEILSACAARAGDFDKAYQIQLGLAKLDKDAGSRMRRQQALRKLRKKLPLDDLQVIRSQVA